MPRAATIRPGSCGEPPDHGTAEPGRVADLVLLDGDPTRCVALLDRSALDAELRRAAVLADGD